MDDGEELLRISEVTEYNGMAEITALISVANECKKLL
jgi:hypothetical protein